MKLNIAMNSYGELVCKNGNDKNSNEIRAHEWVSASYQAEHVPTKNRLNKQIDTELIRIARSTDTASCPQIETENPANAEAYWNSFIRTTT
jgi:hypothetical protein